MTAVKYCQMSLALAPGIAEGWYNLGIAEAGLGKRDSALQAFEQTRLRTLGAVDAQNSIGLKLMELKAYTEAERCLQRAIALAPEYAFAHANMGRLRQEQGKLDEAEKYLGTAIRLQSGLAVLHANLGHVYLLKRSYAAAEASCRQAIELDAQLAQAWTTLGKIHLANKQNDQAEKACLHALELSPQVSEAWGALGAVYLAQNRFNEAEVAFRKDLEISPSSPEAWVLLSSVLRGKKRGPEALHALQKAYELDPQRDYVLGELLQTQLEICEWRGVVDLEPTLAIEVNDKGTVIQPFALFLLTQNPSLQLKALEIYAAKGHPSQPLLGPIPHRSRRERIRIGYYSADFHRHAVSLLAAELFELHDRSRFELIAFSFGPDTTDPIRQRVAHAFDQFIDVQTKNDREIALLSRELGVDIAVNLGGYTGGNRTDIFAMRAAPIQVNYLGFPGTMGAEYMDYLLTDRIICPESSRPYYTEKLAYLPHCFMPHDSTQEISSKVYTRQDFDLPESGFVFCSFNAHQKITPWVFDVWMRLLARVPGSVLWLSGANQTVKDNLRKETAIRGIDVARIVFGRYIDNMAEHLARYRLADLFLDTLPYNAHTTACDALWAGVPVLTCTGESFASRVAASLLHAVGLPELVTSTLAEYEALALALAANPQKLTALRQKLAANRLTAPLFDTRSLARDIERVYCAMYERYLAGMPPDHLHP